MTHLPTDLDDAVATEIAIVPAKVLDSVVSEFEYLLQEAPAGLGFDLAELHGALLAYNLGGRAELLPSVPFGLSTRTLHARRVVRAARKVLDAATSPAHALDLASALVERHLHLIDPELRSLAA